MSAQPVSVTPKDAELKAKKRSEQRSDALYGIGAVLVTIGIGLMNVKLGFIAAGCFCLLFPILELTTGFIRGLRHKTR